MTQHSLHNIKQRLYQRPRQEQQFIAIFIFLFTAFLWLKLFLSPLMQQHQQYLRRYFEKEQEATELKAKIESLSSNKANFLAEYQLLKQQNAELDQKLSPQSLAQSNRSQDTALLRSLLLQGGGELKLISLNSTLDSHEFRNTESMTLQFTGNYFDSLAFLQRLNQAHLGWNVSEFNYRVDNYPNATITMQLTTKAGYAP